MNGMILHDRHKLGHARGQRARTAALLGGLVLALTLPQMALSGATTSSSVWRGEQVDDIAGANGIRSTWIADVDGDGRNELLVATSSGTLLLYKWQGGGWASQVIGLLLGYCPLIEDVGDADNDGISEVLVTTLSGPLRLYDWDGGAWSYQDLISGSAWYYTGAIADADGDGSNEVVVAGYGFYQVLLFTYTSGTWVRSQIDSNFPDLSGYPAVGDAMNLGRPQVYVGTHDQGHIYAYRWDSPAWSRFAVELSTGGIAYTSVGDADNDGQNELVADKYGPPWGIKVYDYSGGAWIGAVAEAAPTVADCSYIVDINGDGRNEIVAASSNGGSVSEYRYLSGGGWSASVLIPDVGFLISGMDVGDAKNQGWPAIVVGQNGGGKVWLFTRTGVHVWQPSLLTENSGVANIRVQRLQDVDQPAMITYGVAGGSASPGVDFLFTNGVLNFDAGVTNLTIPLTILDDALVEGPESVLLGLTNSVSGWTYQVSLAIIDDDTGIEVESAAYTVCEDVGQVVVGVRRQDDSPDPATVKFTTVDDTARAGQDYVARTGTLTFASGEARKEIVVPIIDDALREPAESFLVRLTNVVGGSSLGNLAEATVTISLSDRVTLHVWQGSTNPVPPYSNWETAAMNIQDAVDAALPGEAVLVTNGVYAGGVAAAKPVMLLSVNGPEPTVIDGGGSVRCVSLVNGASLSGFTLTDGIADSGGGVWCESSTAIVSNCVLAANSAYSGGGAYGGTLYHCTLTRNSATCGGGAFESFLNNCTLTGNSAWGYWDWWWWPWPVYVPGQGGGASGGAFYNCILNNNGSDDGGGSYNAILHNCTLTGNSADWGGGASGSTLNNCIVYFNVAGGDYAGSTLNYCCTMVDPGGVGNITNAPLFVDYAGGNLRLQSNSPCINAGNNSYLTNSYFTNLFDLDGRRRIIGATVDIGAYEFATPELLLQHLISRVVESSHSPKQPLLATLEAALKSIHRGNAITAANQLHAFQHKVQAEVYSTDPVLAQELMGAAAEVLEALGGRGSTQPVQPGSNPPLVNVALNKEVSLEGTFFTGGWGSGPRVEAATVVDGIFFPRSTQWDQGSVWWDAWVEGAGTNYIVVDLDGVYRISGFVVQADDNDAYLLEYLDPGEGNWRIAWDVATSSGWGMQTRPDPQNDTVRHVVVPDIITSSLRISAVTGDGCYSVSEIQAYGYKSPPEAVERLIVLVSASSLQQKQPLLAALEAALASVRQGDAVSALSQLQTFQRKVRAHVARSDPALAASLIQLAQEVIEVLGGGNAYAGGRARGRLTAARHHDGHVQLQFAAQRGALYLLEASTNLLHWEKIGVAYEQADGTFTFDDPNASKFPNRFYRVVSP
jgi:hypothetical protein